ncbi:cysteinyl-tRNA synthetase [Dunaliella salina]|uniref:cysteine--tRNA ligase n=1 Tax=Dunaliella salina TaxID=3046 RepID=A0ABQ7G267_DUNSA|nr:cysteinyl-tRNA synthetase [Dunaliella salina]|eukprot:KAF5828699.1 cysteinyl-tRNA synthetase [Dunaliella salina]
MQCEGKMSQVSIHGGHCALLNGRLQRKVSGRRRANRLPATRALQLEKQHEQQLGSEVEHLRSQLHLYNSMSRKKEPFSTRPTSPNRVQMYVCGVTVYDYSHIGHARVYVAFDILYRLLSLALGYDVQYVRNFTDIDDKIIARANEGKEDPLELAGRFIEEFHKDMETLNCLPPTFEPRATDFIPAMIETIERIIANGHGYAVGADVFFDVESLPGYGKLSGRHQEDNRAGERVAVDERKRSPADFALWKAAKPGEPAWPSPWGEGRPGWHIECSSMICRVMGDVIDIHGGGRDLLFPHHENELAQSRAAQKPTCCGGVHEAGAHSHSHGSISHQDGSGSDGLNSRASIGVGTSTSEGSDADSPDFVRYWLHNGFVNVDSEKMSKSLGNFFTIREVLKLYHPLVMRWFLASTHYRAPVNYSSQTLDEASSRLYYIYQSLLDAQAALAAAGPEGQKAQASPNAPHSRSKSAKGDAEGKSEDDAFLSAMHLLIDDVNTPAALSTLSAPLKAMNDLLNTRAGKKNPNRLPLLAKHTQEISGVLGLLGLLPSGRVSNTGSAAVSLAARQKVAAEPAALEVALAEMRQLALLRVGLAEEDVQARIQARASARAVKDFAAADSIRMELENQGIVIMDTPSGTTWRPLY